MQWDRGCEKTRYFKAMGRRSQESDGVSGRNETPKEFRNGFRVCERIFHGWGAGGGNLTGLADS